MIKTDSDIRYLILLFAYEWDFEILREKYTPYFLFDDSIRQTMTDKENRILLLSDFCDYLKDEGRLKVVSEYG